MRKIDEKYQTTGKITKLDGTPIPDDEELILFRGQDKLVVPLLEYYRLLFISSGCPDTELKLLDKRIKDIKAWQKANPGRLKIPGVKLK